MPKGGYRPGSGRKKGVTSRPNLRDYFTEQEIKDLVEKLKIDMQSKTDILKFVGEHIFGKAPQPVDLEEESKVLLKGLAAALEAEL